MKNRPVETPNCCELGQYLKKAESGHSGSIMMQLYSHVKGLGHHLVYLSHELKYEVRENRMHTDTEHLETVVFFPRQWRLAYAWG